MERKMLDFLKLIPTPSVYFMEVWFFAFHRSIFYSFLFHSFCFLNNNSNILLYIFIILSLFTNKLKINVNKWFFIVKIAIK